MCQAVPSRKYRPSASPCNKMKRPPGIALTDTHARSHRSDISQALKSLVHSSLPLQPSDHGTMSSAICTISNKDSLQIRTISSDTSPCASRPILEQSDEQAKRPRTVQWGNPVGDLKSHHDSGLHQQVIQHPKRNVSHHVSSVGWLRI